MPVTGGKPTDRHRLVRHLRVVRGTMRFEMDMQPRFDYGRQPHKLEITEHGAVFRSDGMELTAALHRQPQDSTPDSAGHGGARRRRRCAGTLTMREGEIGGRGAGVDGRARRGGLARRAQTGWPTTPRAFWKRWLRRSTYTGRWREMVDRSAMTLKLMTYAPTGAPVAAPTTRAARAGWRRAELGLPVHLDPGRIVLDARAARAWATWRRRPSSARGSGTASKSRPGTARGPLKIMYRVDGTSDLTEETLDHFEGWRGSRPVRIGNGAADQLQLDIYGEAMDAIFTGRQLRHAARATRAGRISRTIIDWLCEHWDQPDEGIWETRGGRKDFTYGRFQCWVALDRAIRMAERRGRPANIARWTAERDRLYNQIMEPRLEPQGRARSPSTTPPTCWTPRC